MSAINIAICTCQRAQLLRQCLDSIATILLPADTTVTVTIIDNDSGQSARPVVDALASSFPFVLHYVCEARRGIPCARNRAIEETHALRSDYLVFIDDDEWVRPDWLVQLYGYAQQLGGRVVVSGGVISELPASTPDYIRAAYGNRVYRTGEKLAACATNNVIIPIHVTRDLGLRFDESDPLAGGTDTIFFVEAVAQGVEIRRCAEALVHEAVPESRANLRWLSKRKYRAGITEAWRKQKKGRSKGRILVSAVALSGLETAGALFVTLAGNKKVATRLWLKACKYWGVANGVVGRKVDSYRSIDGR